MLLSLILLLGLLVRILFIGTPGFYEDMGTFTGWFRSALEYPAQELYSRDRSINYPPGYALILELTTHVYLWCVHGGHNWPVVRMLIKAPAVAFDLLGAVAAYMLVARFSRPALALGAAAFFALNPALIYISAYWGQLDSVPTVIALVAVMLLLSGIATLAWPVLVLAALVKPPVIILAPLFALYPFASSAPAERKPRLVGAGAGIVLALGLTEALAFAFFPHPTLVAPTRLLITRLGEGSSLFPYTSLNAFNIFAVMHRLYVPDRAYLGPLTVQQWFQGLFVLFAASIYRTYVRRRSAAALLEGSVLLFLAFFLFMPEMHERYQLYATAFAGGLLFRRPYAIAAAVLSVTLLLSLERTLTYGYLVEAHVSGVGINEFEPWLMSICAIANLGAFFGLWFSYGSPLRRRLRRSA
jgi:Gpi18-like mannosyltransferase